MSGLWFEEFEIGQRFEHEWRRTVTEYDNMLFSNLTMNVQPLHIDFEFAKGTEFGKPLVNSLFTLGLMIGRALPQADLPRRHDPRGYHRQGHARQFIAPPAGHRHLPARGVQPEQ